MKALGRILIVCFLALTLGASAQLFKDLEKTVKTITKSGGLSEEDAVAGLKEALIKGTNKGTDIVSQVDGYFKNPAIKIPMPEDARKVESKLRSFGQDKMVDDAILSINRAAEDAAGHAADIFVDAIKNMSIKDAIGIVRGDTTAATQYLQRNTTRSLNAKFRPVIETSLEKVNATKYWRSVFDTYNKIPFVSDVNPDLADYVTGKAIDGLFLMIAKEEVNIRKDPLARTSDILKKVFGS